MMPSLNHTRGKRATPIAIVSGKGPGSQWHDLNKIEFHSPPTAHSVAMSSADPIAAPEAGTAKQAPRSLTFFDLPSETQNEIVQQVSYTHGLTYQARSPAVGRAPRLGIVG